MLAFNSLRLLLFQDSGIRTHPELIQLFTECFDVRKKWQLDYIICKIDKKDGEKHKSVVLDESVEKGKSFEESTHPGHSFRIYDSEETKGDKTNYQLFRVEGNYGDHHHVEL